MDQKCKECLNDLEQRISIEDPSKIIILQLNLFVIKNDIEYEKGQISEYIMYLI